jgi:hypothetical protein
LGHHVRQRIHHDALGNRSLLLRDPDGNLVNLFGPAAEKFSQYAP